MGCTVKQVPAEKFVCPNSPRTLSVQRVAEARLPTEWGGLPQLAGYRFADETDEEYVVLYKGEFASDVPDAGPDSFAMPDRGTFLDLRNAIAARNFIARSK